jgi:hypothetical protein
MGSIDYQTDLMLTAEQLHRLGIKSSILSDAMMQDDVLFARLRTVIVGGASLFQHLYRLAALRRSSEYEYHVVL